MRATFTQACPICGRRIEADIDHHKLTIVCPHCHGAFLAQDPPDHAGQKERGHSMVLRADRLLALLAGQTGLAGAM